MIELPQDRNGSNNGNPSQEIDDGSLETISYVRIPADPSQSLEELSFTPTVAGDAFLTHLKPMFVARNGDEVDVGLLLQQQQQQQQHQGQQPAQTLLGSSGTPGIVKEETLRKVAQSEGHVEVFTLVHATKSNHFVGVNLYLDEVGMLKRLPLNSRASDLCLKAGYNPPPTFYGDVYCGRIVKQNGMAFHNKSLSLKEYQSDRGWLAKAMEHNLEYQLEQTRLTGRSDVSQPLVAGSEGIAKTEDGYSWTQTEEEVEVQVSLPDTAMVNSKDVVVRFQPQAFHVTYRKEPILDLKLFQRVDVDGCTWTIDPSAGSKVVLTMEKLDPALWPRIQY